MSRLCEACNENEMIGVANALGPVSIAFCRRCAQEGIFPWWNIIGYLGMAGPGPFHSSYEEILQVNLKFHGKTREDFDEEVKQVLKSYEEHMEQN